MFHARPRPLRSGRLSRSLLCTAAGFAALLMQGCKTPATMSPTAADPADPHVPVRGLSHRSTTDTYARQRPVEPRGWGDQNQGVAPPPPSGR
jgi:hypothetical protein